MPLQGRRGARREKMARMVQTPRMAVQAQTPSLGLTVMDSGELMTPQKDVQVKRVEAAEAAEAVCLRVLVLTDPLGSQEAREDVEGREAEQEQMGNPS